MSTRLRILRFRKFKKGLLRELNLKLVDQIGENGEGVFDRRGRGHIDTDRLENVNRIIGTADRDKLVVFQKTLELFFEGHKIMLVKFHNSVYMEHL